MLCDEEALQCLHAGRNTRAVVAAAAAAAAAAEAVAAAAARPPEIDEEEDDDGGERSVLDHEKIGGSPCVGMKIY